MQPIRNVDTPGMLRATNLSYIAAAVFTISCGGGSDPANLLLRSGTTVDFSTTVGYGQLALGEVDLGTASTVPLAPEPGVSVFYKDFPGATYAAQREILLFARDPGEYEKTLESLPAPTFSAVPVVSQFDANTFDTDDLAVAQMGRTCQTIPHNVTLPNAFAVPYPIPTNSEVIKGTGPSSVSLNEDPWQHVGLRKTNFLGSTNPNFANFAGAAAQPSEGSVKGVFVYKHGVCSTETDTGATILNQIQAQLPTNIAAGIGDHMGFAEDFADGQADIIDIKLASFVNRDNIFQFTGGFIQQSLIEVVWHGFFTGTLNPAFVGSNYTFAYGLNDGILATTPTLNVAGDTGAFSDSVASSVLDSNSGMAAVESRTIQLAAYSLQTRPLQRVNCTAPDDCNIPCANVPDVLPAKLDATSDAAMDDSASGGPPPNTDWHSTDYCAGAAIIVSGGISLGAAAAGITDQGAIDNLIASVVGPPEATSYPNVRCNFYPSYDSKPICEVIARASRVNVFPDTVELVWFDGSFLPDQTTTGASVAVASITKENVLNPSYALYLALMGIGQGAALCSRQPDSSSKQRPFHTGLAQPCSNGN